MRAGRWTIREIAEADIDEITDYIRPHNCSAARQFVMAVRKDFDFLAIFPGAGSIRVPPTRELEGLRSWSVRRFRNYLIFYRAVPEGVEILRVLHGMRDLDRVLAEGS